MHKPKASVFAQSRSNNSAIPPVRGVGAAGSHPVKAAVRPVQELQRSSALAGNLRNGSGALR